MRRILVVNLALILYVSILASFPACTKRTQPAARPPAPISTEADASTEPDLAAPSIEIAASPSTITRGQETTLKWKSARASTVEIDSGVGTVSAIGSVVVNPLESTTYTATARGPGGEASSSTRVTVVRRSIDADLTSTDIEGLQQAMEEGRVGDIFFDYDRAELTSEAKRTLEENARWFKQFPTAVLVIEGHCDERGTEEYNLALGDRRAQATKQYLVELGIDPSRLETISFGEERPFAPGHDEAAYRLNRRAHFVVKTWAD